jgi:hypothetical protein
MALLPQQADLLSILGVFAEPLIKHERFVRIVGREKLMASDLLSYLMEEKLAELKEGTLRQLQTTLEEAVLARFPDAPLALAHEIRRVSDPQQIQQLIVTVIRAADLAQFEQALAQAISPAP